MFKRGFLLLLIASLTLAACSQAPLSPTEQVNLSAQRLGTAADDSVVDVAVDRGLGAVYTVGVTNGSLDGPNRGGSDMFLRRYNRSGGVVWKQQLGSASEDYAGDIAVQPGGNVYVSFNTFNGDSFLHKYLADGRLLWSRRLLSEDGEASVATDFRGNVYLAGSRYTDIGAVAFVSKYSYSGLLLWSRAYEGPNYVRRVGGLATDAAGNVYVGGIDEDDDYFNTFLFKLNPNGEQLFETSSYGAIRDIAIVGDALYTAGSVVYLYGVPDLETTDAVVGKYTLGGVLQWQKTFGTTERDSAGGISTDTSGNLYVTGTTCGKLTSVDPGGCDIFFRKYNSSGQALWTKQIGSSGDDYGNAVVAYSSGELYLGGEAGGALLGGTYRGGQDGFLRRTDGRGNRVWTD